MALIRFLFLFELVGCMVLNSIHPSHDIHSFYLSLHANARRYKEQLKIFNKKRDDEGKEPKAAQSVEMNNFQEPQVRISVRLAFFMMSLMLLLFRYQVGSLWYGCLVIFNVFFTALTVSLY